MIETRKRINRFGGKDLFLYCPQCDAWCQIGYYDNGKLKKLGGLKEKIFRKKHEHK
jgi:hypothetical protein